MAKSMSRRLKAATLLTTFGLNIVIGFACSLGLDMGYNSHRKKATAENTPNAYLAKDHHSSKAKTCCKKGAKETDDCCSTKVVKILKIDQTIPRAYAPIHIISYNVFCLLHLFRAVPIISRTDAKEIYFARNYHPPIADLRIAIQSFLI